MLFSLLKHNSGHRIHIGLQNWDQWDGYSFETRTSEMLLLHTLQEHTTCSHLLILNFFPPFQEPVQNSLHNKLLD